MTSPTEPVTTLDHTWPWPLDLSRYNRTPTLTEAEYAELDRCFGSGRQMTAPPRRIRQRTRVLLDRLLHPILDVLAGTHGILAFFCAAEMQHAERMVNES